MRTDILELGRMIERIARIRDDRAVALRIGVRAQAEEDLARVMHVAIFVHDHDVFAEHHLSHSPKSVHDLEGLIRILLPDADKHEVVKNTFRRQRHIDDLREIHFENRQENPHAGVAHVEIFHRRNADDRGRINRIAAMGDRR